MGKVPLIDRPTPLMDILKTRPTFVLDQPLIVMLDGGSSSKILGGKLGSKLGGLGSGKVGSSFSGLGLGDRLKSKLGR